MGLMLSVLVFCVGVVEVLDCWHHFLLHLVQPQYNPLPFPLDPHRDILCEKELYPSSDSRRPSNVDISWPKDLSPTDDLHVIRKRVHSETERSFVTDGGTNSSPQIVVCGPDSDDNDRDQYSPTGSWNTSPNHLELGVITESDSSSEVDEPSQIENLAYKKDCTPNYSQSFLKKDDRANELPHDSTDEKRADDLDWESDEEGNPDWSFTENDSEIKSGIEKDIYDKQSAKNVPEVSVLPDLPVFTDNILSTNVTKVSGRYPSENMSSSPLFIEETCKSVFTSDELTDSNDIKLSRLTKDNISNPLTNYEYSTSSENQSISSILDEGLEPIPEFPEMRLLGKSPLRPEQSSDSSLNTSDASLLVKSKTSDRPLVIRVSPSRCLQQEADTVISTELEAVENKTGSGINEKLPKVDDVKGIDINEHYLDDFRRLTDYQKSLEGMQSQSTVYPEITGECATDEKISIQPDTNSSSSSLSGIPQLPEDSKDAALRPFLPTDNSYEIGHSESDEPSTDVSYSITDESHKSSVTSETNYSGEIDAPFSLQQLKEKHLEKEPSEKHEPIVPVLKLMKETTSKNELQYQNRNNSNLQEAQNISPENENSLVVENNENKHNDKEENIQPNLSNITLPEEAKAKNKNSSSEDSRKVEGMSKEDFEIANLKNIKGGSSSQEKNKSQEKHRSSQKRRTKRSARDSSKTTSEGDMPEFCQAKESDEEDHADSRVQTTCVRASPPLGEVVCPKKEPSTSVPAQKEVTPSTSKVDAPENKAFWVSYTDFKHDFVNILVSSCVLYA
ncbi:hypothetical protein J6590_003349 [Homalodisca vitripennis]|nr:hypothetical protein J6590_003349 [Homalodisca vitripennis]